MYKDVKYIICFSGGSDTTYLMGLLRALNPREMLIYHYNDNTSSSEFNLRSYFQHIGIRFISFKDERNRTYLSYRTRLYANLLDIVYRYCHSKVYVITGHNLNDYILTIKMRMLKNRTSNYNQCFNYIDNFLYRGVRVLFVRPLFFSDMRYFKSYCQPLTEDYGYTNSPRRKIKTTCVPSKFSLLRRQYKVTIQNMYLLLEKDTQTIKNFIRRNVYTNTEYINIAALYNTRKKYTACRHHIISEDFFIKIRPELEYAVFDPIYNRIEIANYFHIYIYTSDKIIPPKLRYTQESLELQFTDYKIRIKKFENADHILLFSSIIYLRCRLYINLIDNTYG